jgi:hypothetical protein
MVNSASRHALKCKPCSTMCQFRGGCLSCGVLSDMEKSVSKFRLMEARLGKNRTGSTRSSETEQVSLTRASSLCRDASLTFGGALHFFLFFFLVQSYMVAALTVHLIQQTGMQAALGQIPALHSAVVYVPSCAQLVDNPSVFKTCLWLAFAFDNALIAQITPLQTFEACADWLVGQITLGRKITLILGQWNAVVEETHPSRVVRQREVARILQRIIGELPNSFGSCLRISSANNATEPPTLQSTTWQLGGFTEVC